MVFRQDLTKSKHYPFIIVFEYEMLHLTMSKVISIKGE